MTSPQPAAPNFDQGRRAELPVGPLFFSSMAPIVSPLAIGGNATVLQINTDHADGLWTRALDAGAGARHELADAFWGERHGQLTDPFGHRWNIAQRVRDVPHDEIVAAAAQAFGSG